MAPASRLLGLDDLTGFRYRDDFITADEESALLEAIEAMTFAAFEMRGVVAKRRVAFFGESYDRGRAEPIPAPLLPLRDRVAAWVGVPAHAFAMALVNEYPAGAPIGWHRDAPQYDIVSGVSLLSDCRMRFRPYVSPAEAARTPAPRRATHEVPLRRRSGYLMAGVSRTSYEHHIPPVDHHRYSVTFRTLR